MSIRRTGQNTSSAVMQQRTEARKSLDDFPTPPWATRALLAEIRKRGWDLGLTCREPAANRGHMVKPLREQFASVDAADIHDYGAGFPVQDFLFGPMPDQVDWSITNPPFRLAEQFIARMHATSSIGCAVLVRAAFLEGVNRHASLFSRLPPRLILQFTERVVMHRGRLSADGSTATAYCWLVWLRSNAAGCIPPVFGWIAPCRRKLEMTGDYTEAT